jgi:hypothetical protein
MVIMAGAVAAEIGMTATGIGMAVVTAAAIGPAATAAAGMATGTERQSFARMRG